MLSWTPLGDALVPHTSPTYCTQADVSLPQAGTVQSLNHGAAAYNASYNASQPLKWTTGDAAAGLLGGGTNLDQSNSSAALRDQAFVAGSPEAGSLRGEGLVKIDGSADTAAAATTGVPAPFWHKVGNQPTYAPDWYANQGSVTRDVYYDSKLTASENGALLQQVLSKLSAGDHVRIHAGTYSVDSYFLITAAGTADRPITIEGAPGEQVVITRFDASQNVINIDQSQYLILQNLSIRGGSTGVKVMGVNNFMLYNSEVAYTGNNAIAGNSNNTSYLYFVDNTIHHTGAHGEAFYLGADDGSRVTHHTYVIGNYIHDLVGGTITQGDGIEIKDLSYAVTIKYNFIENTNYPGIILYRTGRGMTDRNVVEENVILHSNDVGIQVVADAIIRNNLVVTNGLSFYSKPRTTNPQNLTVANNTFISGGAAVKVYSWEASNTFANNAIYSGVQQYVPTGTGAATAVGNVQLSSLTAFTNLNLQGTALDATPSAGSPMIGAANTTYLPVYDLNGQTRATAADAGAVDYASGSTTPTDPAPPTQTASKSFDFGTDTSPVAAGQTGVNFATRYSSATGYGWVAGAIDARDRGTPDDAKRDFDLATAGSMTFGVDLPAGTYQVTLVAGDAYYGGTGMGVQLEGKAVDTISRGAGEFVTK
ncbi:MAG: right-handed parallel beta-helix repeat-containing protein, partial [Aureliella sp.]